VLSVVIPVKDEEDVLPHLADALLPVLRQVGTYEVLFVDDGSTDRSRELILKMRAEDSGVKLVALSRSFGQQAAIAAGLDHATGDAVVFMDSDLQDPPEVIPELVAAWRAGHDVVTATRAVRDDGLFKRVTAFLYYRLLRSAADVDIAVDAGDFSLIDRRAADALRQLSERNRFTRGLRSWIGFRHTTVSFVRPTRAAGKTKYRPSKLLRLALDGLFAFSSAPLRLATWLGFFAAFAGVIYLGIALFARLYIGHIPSGWTSIIAIVLVLGGCQLFVMGVLGQYVARVYDETKARPLYIVAERHGTEP
jgi:dolichol-phosphate mannosyltransferase